MTLLGVQIYSGHLYEEKEDGKYTIFTSMSYLRREKLV